MRKTLLAALTLLTVVVRVAVAQELDSFKVYRVEEIAAEQVVSLQGQFDDQPKEVTLERLVSFATPSRMIWTTTFATRLCGPVPFCHAA